MAKQIQDYSLCVVIEQCSNCASHNWNNRHVEAKYQAYTAEVSEQLNAKIPGVQIFVNCIPKAFVNSDNYQNLIMGSETDPTYQMVPRLGAFEVSAYLHPKVGGSDVLFFSKLMSQCWPSAPLLGKRIEECWEEAVAGNGEGLPDIASKYQTSGQVKKFERKAATKGSSAASNFMDKSVGKKMKASTSKAQMEPAAAATQAKPAAAGAAQAAPAEKAAPAKASDEPEVDAEANQPKPVNPVEEEAKMEDVPEETIVPTQAYAIQNWEEINDGKFPVFNGGDSLLSKHLTPSIFVDHVGVRAGGYSLGQLIWGGVKNERQKVGVFPGNRMCYSSFDDLIYPILAELHGCDMTQNHKGIPMPKVKEMQPWNIVKHESGAGTSWSCAEQAMVKHVRVEIVRNFGQEPLLAGQTAETLPKLLKKQDALCTQWKTAFPDFKTMAEKEATDEMKAKKCCLSAYSDATYKHVICEEVQKSAKLLCFNGDTFGVMNHPYEQFRFISQKKGFNIGGAFDDLASITDCADKADCKWSQTNFVSWTVGNLANAGAFKFEICLETPMAEIDKDEAKKIQTAIVPKIKALGCFVKLDWKNNQTTIHTNFKLGRSADQHIDIVIKGARMILDAFQKYQESEEWITKVTAPLAELFKTCGAANPNKVDCFKAVGAEALAKNLIAVNDLEKRVPAGLADTPDWAAEAAKLATTI